MSTLPKMIGIVGFVFVLGLGIENALAACPTFPTGFTCECNAADTEWVCAKWGQGGTPTLNSDFTVTYVSGVPNVTLSTADLAWELYSEVISSGAAADMGTLALDDSGADDYEVTIANGIAAGAANVATIDLNDAGFTGYSSIEGGKISGNLTGGLTLVQDSGGNGGELTFTISGDVSGAMTIPVLKSLSLSGDLSAKIDVTDEIDGSGFVSKGSVTTTGELEVYVITSGNISFLNATKTFAGTLDLESGISTGALVKFSSPLTSDAVVDLGGVGVQGTLSILAPNAGDVIDGGTVRGGVVLASGGDYSGSATFKSLGSNGTVRVLGSGDLTGSITVTHEMFGTISVSQDVTTSSGLIDVRADLEGHILISGDLGADARVLVGGALADPPLGGAGSIVISGMCDGDIEIGEQTDSLTLIHLVGGLNTNASVEINTSEGAFNAEGDIVVASVYCAANPPDITFDGCIRIYDDSASGDYGALEGAISVCGCHNPGDLNICVDGEDNGNVTISQNGCHNQVNWSCNTCP